MGSSPASGSPALGSGQHTRRMVMPVAGAAFALAFFASFLIGNRSDIHERADTTLGNYADDYNKLKGMVGWALAVAAVLALIWFLAGLVSHLRAAGSTDSEVAAVAIAGSVLAVTVSIASAVRAAPVGDLLLDDEQRAGTSGKLTPTFADFAQTTGSLYDWLVFFGVGLGAAALVLAVTLAARRTALLPRWLQWMGYAAVPVLVFVAFLNVLVLVLWFLAVSIAIASTVTGSAAAA